MSPQHRAMVSQTAAFASSTNAAYVVPQTPGPSCPPVCSGSLGQPAAASRSPTASPPSGIVKREVIARTLAYAPVTRFSTCDGSDRVAFARVAPTAEADEEGTPPQP